MNYVILCPTRSGSTYLGEFLQWSGLPYYNELFTPEICRRRRIWPLALDERLNETVVDLVASVDGAGFKLTHSPELSGVYAALKRRPSFRVVHIIRDDLLEQAASWLFLNRAGVSLARADGSLWNTDGEAVESTAWEPVEVAPADLEDHFEQIERMRWLVWTMYRETHPYLEIRMQDLFTELLGEVCDFLGLSYNPQHRPDHIRTPRPRARDYFANYAALERHFRGTRHARYFAS